MNCPSCREALPEAVDFCGSCGVPTARFHTNSAEIHARETLEYGQRQDPFVGMVLDSKYELVERLGEGGMGAVYRARRLHIGDEVAVKVLHRGLLVEERSVERFRREARSAAMISHPNVVTIHDFGDARAAGSPAYIVMELVRGLSLRELLRREGRLSPARAVALMCDICAGVGTAHRQGLLHRDLKPDNVIVVPATHEGERETAKVVDFGLAKLRDRAPGTALTEAGAILGTLYYMSPEQCGGEELDARADVYSLGAMFFEMLTGEPPFRTNTLVGLIASHLKDPPPAFPPTLQIPSALAAACYRALAKNPNERQRDALALSRDLQAALVPAADSRSVAVTQKSAPARPTTPATLLIPPQKTDWLKWTLAGVAALLLILAVLGAATVIGYRALRPQPGTVDADNAGGQNKQSPAESGTLPAKNRETDRSESENATTSSAATNLTGVWTGTYGPLNQPAKLTIKHHNKEKFDGVLEQSGVVVAFRGAFDPASRDLTIKETEVLSGSGWSLGEDVGKLSADGQRMSGTGKDVMGGQFGISYQWTFSRQ
jgi:eukaryotic-like serine/threonine-protein kinase